jgi:protein-tyrosine phosphatase
MRRVGDFPLWIGTARDARDLRAVLNAGIEAIVDLAVEEPPIAVTRELVYLRLPLLDGDGNTRQRLRMAMWAIEELVGDQVPTLVACSAGMSRSPALVAVVVAQFKGIPAEDVLRDLRMSGPVDVSPGLWQSLQPAFYSYDRPA